MTQPSATWTSRLPSFSVVMPVHAPSPRDLMRAVESVRAQVWPAVELCLVDDASRNPEVVRALDALGKEAGVRLRRLPENQGIAAATNAATLTAMITSVNGAPSTVIRSIRLAMLRSSGPMPSSGDRVPPRT